MIAVFSLYLLLLEARKSLRALGAPGLQSFPAKRLMQRLVRYHRLDRRVELRDGG